MAKKKEMGYPLRFLLELDGLTPQEIERVMGMVRDEASDPELQRILNRARTATGTSSGDAELSA